MYARPASAAHLHRGNLIGDGDQVSALIRSYSSAARRRQPPHLGHHVHGNGGILDHRHHRWNRVRTGDTRGDQRADRGACRNGFVLRQVAFPGRPDRSLFILVDAQRIDSE